MKTTTIPDRAWTPALPARSGFALSLREIRRARSQRARLIRLHPISARQEEEW